VKKMADQNLDERLDKLFDRLERELDEHRQSIANRTLEEFIQKNGNWNNLSEEMKKKVQDFDKKEKERKLSWLRK